GRGRRGRRAGPVRPLDGAFVYLRYPGVPGIDAVALGPGPRAGIEKLFLSLASGARRNRRARIVRGGEAMTTYWRRRLLLGSGMVALALGAGCDIFALPFFLFAPEPKREAELLKLASAGKTQQVRVALLAANTLEMRPEFLRADYQLSDLLAHRLVELCQYNRENVVVLSPRKVEEFKNAHPNWNRGEMELAEIGRLLKADYVINLEIQSL